MVTTRITLQIDSRTRALLARLRNVPAEAVQAVIRGSARAAPIVLGNAVKRRFTGQGPFPFSEHRLGVRTNRLRQSLGFSRPQIVDGNLVRLSFGSGVGTDVKEPVSYFAIHEFGFKGKVQVRAHTRRAVAQGPLSPKGKVTRAEINKRKTAILVKSRNNFSLVKAHTRNLNIAARAPLGTELGEERNRKAILVEINRELSAALLGTGGPA